MEDDDHEKQVFALQTAAEMLSTKRYGMLTSRPPCSSAFLFQGF